MFLKTLKFKFLQKLYDFHSRVTYMTSASLTAACAENQAFWNVNLRIMKACLRVRLVTAGKKTQTERDRERERDIK